ARERMGVAVVGAKIYAMGGGNSGGALTVNEEYDPATDAWTTKTALPAARSSFEAGVVSGKIYAIGGSSAQTQEYDPAADTWTTKASIPTNRSNFASGVVGGKVYALGGGGAAPTEEYNPATDAWATKAPIPTARYGLAAAVVGGRIYTMGGGGSPLTTHEQYDPGTASSFTALTPNTQYTFKAKARNSLGVETPETADVSTYTLAATPLSAGTTFLAVFASSANFQWAANGNPVGTQFRVTASTAGDFNVDASSRVSAWFAATSTSVVALSPYTTWYFRVQARNGNNIETAYTVLGSTFTPLFTPVLLAGTAGDSYGGRWGDFDADGDLDLLVANFAANASRVLRNDGNGVFTALTVAGAPAALDAAWGDFDGDGDLDIAFANYSGDEVVARYDGGTSFTLLTLTGTGGASRGVAWGDYDNDGDLDLAVGNDTGQDEVLARNDGGGLFSTAALTGSGGSSMGVAWGDADNDGDLDLLVFNDSSANEVLARNDGKGGFAVSPLAGTGGSNRRGAWADFDADGDLDFAAAGASADAEYLARNDGTGAFAAAALPGTTASGEDLSWGDFDGDGDLDLIVSNAGAPAYLLRNQGGSFTRQDVEHPFGDARSARWGDYDGDGDLDVGMVARSGSTDEGLLRNESDFPNPPPAAPAVGALTLESGVAGATLTVTWAPGSDGGAATASLSYAIVVATAPMALSGDSLRVVAPSSFVAVWNQGLLMGDRLSGAQRIPFRLDAPNVLTANFKSDATYYIRLQTIDVGLKRSAWGAEVSTYVFRAEPPSGRAVLSTGTDGFAVSYATVGAAAYLLEASTAADFSGTLHRSSTTDLSASSLALQGLTPNTTYQLRMGSLWQRATAYAAALPGTAVTQATIPAAAAETWLELHESSAAVAWLRNGNPVDVTTYTVVASTGAAFPNGFSGNRSLSTAPAGGLPQGVVTGLSANTTYYLHVAAVNHAGFASAYVLMSATATRIESPSAILFDEISTATLLARATAAPSGFTNLAVGTSAVNFAKGGVYQGWVAGSSVTLSTGLTPNTLYTFSAKSRNMHGVESGQTALVTTCTLAAVPSTATPTFPNLGVSSLTLQWTHNGNPAGTEFLVGVSTDPNLGDGTVKDTGWTTALSSAILGLTPNSTYYSIAIARNQYGIETATQAFGSTVTLAAEPLSVASTWTAVSTTSLTAAWDSNGNPAGTRFEALLSTAVLPNGLPTNLQVSTYPYGAPAAAFAALTPNTTYYLGVRAVNHAGTPNVGILLGSTITLAAVPAASTAPFAGVFQTSMTVQWSSGTNPSWTEYRVDAATSADFGGLRWSTSWEAFTSTTVLGLTRNTTYHLRVEARNSAGTRTAFLSIGATSTLVNFPVDGGSPFPMVGLSSMSAAWASAGNPSWTVYEAVVSTLNATPDGSADEVKVTTTDTSGAALGGLQANATHYLFVRAVNWNGVPSDWAALGTTVTRVETPTSVYFDEVASNTIVASAYAPTPAFSNLHLGTAATNVAIGGVYQGWHRSAWTARAGHAVYGPAAVVDGRLTMTGFAMQTRIYDTRTDAWSSGANVPYAGACFYGQGMAAYQGKVYVIAGDNCSSPIATNRVYDPASDSWAALPNLSGPRRTNGAALVGDFLCAAGGWNFVDVTTNECLNLTTGLWETRAARPNVGEGAQSLSLGGKMYVLGQGPVDIYDPAANTWAAGTAMPAARSGATSFTVGGKLFVAGGQAGAALTARVEEYDPAAGVWARRADMPTARRDLTSAAYRGKAWAVGNGTDGSVNEEYDPGLTAVFAGLTPNTLYTFKAKARNQNGLETPESADVSTYTLAAVPSTAAVPFTALGTGTFTAAWTQNNNPAPTQYRLNASTAAGWTGAADLTSNWFAGTSAGAVGLSVNTTYYVRVKARNGYGLETAYADLGATATLAAVPASSATPFSQVAQTSMTVAWALGLNPAGTAFRVRGSTAPTFTGSGDVDSGFLVALSTGFTGLAPDATYYWRVAARNHAGLPTAALDVGTQATNAFEPVASSEPFHAVWVTSANVQWLANGNPPTTVYQVKAATAPDFSGSVLTSGWVAFLSTTVTGLSGDATYYWRVRARGVSGLGTDPLTLGSTTTLAADPQAPAAASVGPSEVFVAWGAGGNREADSAGAWSSRTALPAARERHAGLIAAGRFYVTGGLVAGAPSAEVWSADVSPSGALGAWRREADLPAARESHALAAYAGRLYVLGGFDGSVKGTVYSADLSTAGVVSGWRPEASLPAARSKLAAAASGGWLYAFGGDNGVVSQATVYRAPLATDGRVGSWATAAALPAARNSHAAAVSGGRVYVAGGLGAGVAPEVWSAALAGPTVGPWVVQTPLSVPVFRHALLAGGGALVLVGGHDGAAATYELRSAPLASDGTVGAWGTLGVLPLARFGHAAALEGSNVFVAGGADDVAAAADVLQSGLGGTQYLVERADDAGFTTNVASAGWRAGSGAGLPGLTPNSIYHLRVSARALSGVAGAPVVAGSTLTPAAVPGAVPSTFTLVEAGSMTLTWANGGNPAGTEFLAALATATDFTSILATSWTTSVSSTVYGLSPNTTYYAAVVARDALGRQTRELSLGTTVTAAAVPQSAVFPSVVTTGLSVAWSTAGNPSGTRYEALLAAASSFASVSASSVTLSSGAAFSGLLSATTYYVKVRALNRLGSPSAYSAFVSTVTGGDTTAPAAVTGLGLHATDTPGVLLAAWTAPGDDGVSGALPVGSRFYLQWGVGDPAAVAWSTVNAQLAPSTGPVAPGAAASVFVTGLPVGASVYARVWTADESDNVSAPSSTAAAWVSPFAMVRLDGVGTDAGRWASAALDRAGDAHVAYTAGTLSQELRYLKRTAGTWSAAEAPDPGVPAEDVLVAVDGAGVPQAAYRNSSTGQLRFAKRGAGWAAAPVASGDLHPGGLALDATGFAHVSYYDAALPGLRYARWDGAAWQLSTVEGGAGVGRLSSLALDAGGVPHVAYYDSGSADLKHASRTAAGAWLTSTVDSAGNVGSSPTLVLDGDGRPSVFYVDASAKDLKLARFDGASWALSVVDSSAEVAGVGGAALDGAGRAVVTYYDGTAGDLLLARGTGADWVRGALESFGDVGAWSGVAVEADGGLLAVHYDGASGDLKAETWAAALTPPLGGNPRGRVQAPAAFGGVVASATGIQWTWVDSAVNELGWRLYGASSSTGPFSVVADSVTLPATAGTGTQRLYSETGLTAHTTYYRYVAAVSSGGAVVSPMAAVFPFTTVDTTPPTVTDNQGGDTVWRRAAGMLYNVDFTDAGGSALERFEVKASSVSGGTGPDLIAFTTVAVSILADSYTADWALPPAVFAALRDAATNYITVRAVDGNGNATVSTDVFTVLKDTTPPTLGDNQSDDPVRRAAGGTAYDVDAFDAGSGLDRFQYSVSTKAASGDAGAVNWTDIFVGGGSTSTVADWTLAFAGLLGDSTNYVSVRAWDRAGSTSAIVDAFSVFKDTSGPRLAVLTPGATFQSVLSALAGTAADGAGVGSVQVAVQEAPSTGGSWFDGAAFTQLAPVWFAASGTASWTYATVPAWVDGREYRVAARGTDALGSLSVVNSTADFTFDSGKPTATVTVPANGATLSVLPAFSGLASDPGTAPSGLLAIELRVQRVADGLYWNWPLGFWGAAPSSTSPALGAPWSFPLPADLRAALAAQTSYFVSVRSVDNAVPANVGSFAGGSTFTWTDATAPAAVTDFAASSGTAPGEVRLDWTAPGDDGSVGDLALGEYRIDYSTDPAAVFSTAAAQVAFSTANVKAGSRQGRVFGGLKAGATYYARIFLADDAGNWSALSNAATTYAGVQPFSRIRGYVRKASSEGVTAVQLEAYSETDLRVSNTFSLADGSGTYSLEGIPDGLFRVQATWTADEVTSSVWLDNVAVGTDEVLFTLEVSYTLSTLTGTLASLSSQALSPSGFLVRAAEGGYSDARVDLLRAGTAVAQVKPDPTGRWTIPNLLPGKYAVRAFNGLEYTDPQDVQLGEGETREVVFVFDPLPEASVFAFPNPARTGTTFRLVSALPGLEAQVTIFDIAGTLVKEIPGSAFVAKAGGLYHADWDLTNDNGESVASGVYLFMVKVKGNNGQSGKVIKKLAIVR
ncbi:hypothetical protein EPO15_12755, partial [bacterium]